MLQQMMNLLLVCFLFSNFYATYGRDHHHQENSHVATATAACDPHSFRCLANGACVPSRWRCDGRIDCGDGSDERDCSPSDTACTPARHLYQCQDHSACIHLRLVCDGSPQCEDGSDEAERCLRDDCDRHRCAHKCYNTPSGPVCACRDGFTIAHDKTACNDVDECSTWPPVCSQVCHNTPATFHCSCLHGYQLQDTTLCMATGKQPVLMYSSARDIFTTGVRTGTSNTLRGERGRILDLTVSVRHDTIFWIDANTHHILASSLDGHNIHTILQHGLIRPSRVDYDWVTSLLYIVDSGLEQLLACEADGSVCVVIKDQMNEVTDIVVHPLLGRVYSSHCGSAGSRLLAHTLSGMPLPALVNEMSACAMALTVDVPMDELYWSDQHGVVSAVSLDGSRQRAVLAALTHAKPRYLAVFEQRLFVTDGRFVRSVDKYTGQGTATINALTNEKHDLVALDIVHRVRQSGGSLRNPCSTSPCSHVCALHKQKHFKCFCPVGMRLASNGHKCTDDGHSPLLLAAPASHILQYYPNSAGHYGDVLPTLQNLSHVAAMAFDTISQSLFLSDVSHNRIYRMPLSKPEAVSTVVSEQIFSVDSMAVDAISRNLYWADSTQHLIEASRLDGSHRTTILADAGLPCSLAILPSQGLLFYTDCSPDSPRIVRCHMTGDNCSVVLQAPHVSRPLGLVVHGHSRRLYWADPELAIIAAAGLDGTDIVVLKHDVAATMMLAVLSDTLYWSDGHTIHFTSLWAGGSTGILAQSVARIGSLLAVDRATQPAGTNGCKLSHDGCSHVCVPGPGDTYSCKCPHEYMLSNDLHTCLDTGDCPSSWLRCSSSRCVPPDSVCDGHDDCEQGEDELPDACAEVSANRTPGLLCDAESFGCTSSRRCIHLLFVCDGEVDCRGGEDEAPLLCANRTCSPAEFTCPQASSSSSSSPSSPISCIPLDWLCDAEPDCPDGADERVNCSCPEHWLRCRDESGCFPQGRVCDGHDDCDDASDEPDFCTTLLDDACPPEHWGCADGWCVPLNARCDGFADCGDASDEQDCPHASTCSAETYICQGGAHWDCIPLGWRCDGDDDCVNGDDEHNCHAAGFVCFDNEYTCRSIDVCIPLSWMCDGSNECPDGSDEDLQACPDRHHPSPPPSPSETAPPSTTEATETGTETETTKGVLDRWMFWLYCDETDFQCASGDCVNAQLVCDGDVDCQDGSDENRQCGVACYHDNGGCSQVCVPLPSGARCECTHHYRLLDDGKTCQKKRDCSPSGGVPACSHACEETTTGVKCHCHPGYYLAPDHSTCLAQADSDAGVTLLYTNTRNDVIMRLNYIGGRHATAEPITESNGKPATMDADGESIIYYDLLADHIVHLTGTSHNVLVSHVRSCERLTVDWVARNVYYTDEFSHAVWACSIQAKDQCARVISEDVDKPRAIALYPAKGLMFWTDWGRHPSITRAWMDGSHRETVVSSALGWPNGLAVDMERDRLYWADALLDVIESSELDGTDRRVIASASDGVLHPNNVQVFEDAIYWTDWAHKAIHTANKFTATNFTTVLPSSGKALDLRVVHSVLQPPSTNHCASLSCASLCLLTPTAATCRCSHKQRPVQNDNQITCVTIRLRPPPIIVIDRTTTTPELINDAHSNCPEGVIGCENRTIVTHNELLLLGGQSRYAWVAATLCSLLVLVVLLILVIYCCRRPSRHAHVGTIRFRNSPFSKRPLGGDSGTANNAYENPIYRDDTVFPETKLQMGIPVSASEESLDSTFRYRRDSLLLDETDCLDTKPMIPARNSRR